MMFLFLFVACEPPEETPEEETEKVAPPPEMEITIVPASVDFGVQPLGAAAVQVVTIQNIGEGDVQLSAIYADSDEVTLDAALNMAIGPGASEDVTVTWTPPGPTSLADQIGLLMRAPNGSLEEVPVPLSGTAAGPVVTLSTGSVDFGTVSVGCGAESTLTIGNTGTESLVIDGIAVDGLSELTLTSPDGDLTALPWTLAPYQTRTLRIAYAPTDQGTLAGVLQITTDDPVSPVSEVVLSGLARIDEDNSITFDVGPTQNITAMFAMNQIAVHDARFEPALPAFFEYLNDARVSYRVTLLHEQTGIVDSDVLYIDETFTVDEAVATALDMVAAATGDNDYLLDTCDNALAENVDWLVDESDGWAESRFSCVAFNSDTEQSSDGNANVYVNRYLAYKEDSADVLVHAVSGPARTGCSSGSAFAEPADMLDEAATLTGGTFTSWCEPDWAVNLEAVAAGVVGEVQHFSLTGDPAEWSIEVWVNSARLSSGWTYDAEAMEIVFDDETYPAYGAEVRVDYIMNAVCE